MPIVIARTGEIAPVPSCLTQEQRNNLWTILVGKWAETNPETFRALLSAVDHQGLASKRDH